MAAVPVACFEKSKVKVCQAPAVVVKTSVSTDLLGSPWSSTFSRTGIPASGEKTRTDILVWLALKAILGVKPSCAAPVIVVPANTSEPAARTTLATMFAALVGSGARLESSAPPKPMKP